jgi:uncharacterized membrane protein
VPEMDYETIFELVKPYLKKNYFGMPHTRRVFDIAKQNFDIPIELEEMVFCSIIMHDIGGNTIEQQYKDGPQITASILTKLGYNKSFVDEVCEIVRTHHNHPDNASLAFKILYDSDKLVMFSREEFSHYNQKPFFDWTEILKLFYYEHAQDLAKKLLQQRTAEESVVNR